MKASPSWLPARAGCRSGHAASQLSRAAKSPAWAGGAERLAGVSGRKNIHLTAPRAAVEGGNVRPDRRLIQSRVFHPRHESGVCVPLAPANSSVSRQGKRNSKLKPAGSGGKGDSRILLGRYNHIYFPFWCSCSSGLERSALTWLMHPHRGHLIARSSAVPLPKSLLQWPQRMCGASCFSRMVKILNCAPCHRVIALWSLSRHNADGSPHGIDRAVWGRGGAIRTYAPPVGAHNAPASACRILAESGAVCRKLREPCTKSVLFSPNNPISPPWTGCWLFQPAAAG